MSQYQPTRQQEQIQEIVSKLTLVHQTMLVARIEVLQSLLEKESIRIDEIDQDCGKLILNFLNKLVISGLKEETKIGLVFLLTLAKYPTTQELDTFCCKLEYEPIFDLFLFILNCKEFYEPINLSCKLVMASHDTLYCDVTHTIDCPVNTGIQRVVRTFCKILLEKKVNVKLFRVLDHRPVLLVKEELWKLDNWREISKSDKHRKSTKFQRLKERIRRHKISYHLYGIVKELLFPIKSLVTKFRELEKNNLSQELLNSPSLSVVIFAEANVCLPELAVEEFRSISFYPSAKKIFSFSLSMIVYDLIPVLNPNYCDSGLVTGFMQYLTLLKYANRISCISQDCFSSVEAFLRELIKPNHQMSIKYHLLSGDFFLHKVKTHNNLSPSTIPKILCVGTIEIRKNHISLLRATVNLWKTGYDFELVIVGRYGWKCEDVVNEINRLRSQGYKLKWLHSCSDEELAQEYQSCTFSIFVSRVEGFGLPILESLSYGKPCICSNIGSMKEIAELAGGCLLVNPDPNDIQAGIRQLLTDRVLYEKLRQEALNMKWHSWEDYATQVYEFFMGR